MTHPETRREEGQKRFIPFCETCQTDLSNWAKTKKQARQIIKTHEEQTINVSNSRITWHSCYLKPA